MKQLMRKSRMLYFICFMSAVILILACNAMFPEPVKDWELLSDGYLTAEFPKEGPSVEELRQWAQKNNCRLMTGYVFSNGKTADFDEELLRFLGVDVRRLKRREPQENTALVNEAAKGLCYERDGEIILPFRGTDYRVIGTYRQELADLENRTDYILNQSAGDIQKSNYYTYVFLDSLEAGNSRETGERFREAFPGARIMEWRGGLSGSLDARPAMAMVIAVCGCILCLNCAGYSGAWVRSQKKEFAVRRLVGAGDGQNHLLLLKRFAGIWAGAYIPAVILCRALLFYLKEAETLTATRRLLGEQLDPRAALLAGAAVFLIGILVTEMGRLGEKRRSVLLGLRRDGV